MKHLACFLPLLFLPAAAFSQNIPVCSPNNPGPNCTDYFGVGNWANSPVPAGSIVGYNVVASGAGYVNPIVAISDTAGSGATAASITLVLGGVTRITPGLTGSGYIAPQVTVVDVGAGGSIANPTCGPPPAAAACGSGALVTAVIGGTIIGGMPKFVPTDTLPDLKSALATNDSATFPGSDYYEIALVQYKLQMHSSLPPTTLRGYVQVPAGSTGCPLTPAPKYLGPVILAQKNRPVRVKFTNCLPAGAGGNLFIPTDTTYGGSGPPYTQNRATLHLHGGASPWISDGTPHQWTVPVGESPAVPQRGDSTQMVPDMYFVNGKVVPQCSATVLGNCSGGTAAQLPAGATNDPGQGSMTFYWTNQQGARLMFYHDHSYGLTRLNVYVGEAAGYLLNDTVEENALAAATVPGTLNTTAPDLAHLIPLVIQDKTFIPGQPQLMAQDPTWVGNFGATPVSPTGSNGDLWFPHVYMTNQNPQDPNKANGFGRWDYGPWFFPPQTQLSAATPPSAVTQACTSIAYPNQVMDCPITPNPSGTPEAFMDTPVLNGKAYPVLNVSPEAYRFKILPAGNDRSMNLSWYVADATGKDVAMLPASIPTNAVGTLPLCTQTNPLAVPQLSLGLAGALLDTAGNPLNGTGLPANCWPSFGPNPGIPAAQTMWAADGRAGGAPDPTKAGPPWIQIATEGGLMPAPAVIPAMPVNYEQNTRSITITSVAVHGLWLGPAERADVIVDFSKFAGKTLILYNDAPTPAPAIDSRLDYFTGDGDQTPIGGAPNTLPGYGPNTRTLMQVNVAAGTTSKTGKFSLPALTAALPSIFAMTQPQIIVPEPSYPPASGAYSANAAYSGIHDYTLTYYPIGSTTPVVNTNERKAIQELFTLDYGRMNATLGTELPLVNFQTQTTIPLSYIDPPTEVIKQGDTQLWKITHNGVDTHFIHFHLFNVQVVNRVGWDGSLRQPDPNELGWKDTVRMNPLEDILVALQPITPVVPFPLKDSFRKLDVTQPIGSDCPTQTSTNCAPFTNLNPFTNTPATTPNKVQSFGWEYVWHCHILGHEENDMMRSITYQVPPEAPSKLTATAIAAPGTGQTLSWTDNSASEFGFVLERATNATFTTGLRTFAVAAVDLDANGQGVTWGKTITFADASATTPPYYYRVQAWKPDASYWTAGPNINSAYSNIVSVGAQLVTLAPASLAFGNVSVGTTSAAQTVTLTNSGAVLTITGFTVSAGYVETHTCPIAPATLAANGTCTISVQFKPTALGATPGTLTIANSSANPSLTVALTGTGTGLPGLTITANNGTMSYGAVVPPITASFTPANPTLTTQPACTTTATSKSPVGSYPTTCAGAAGNYAFTYVSGTMAVTPVPLTVWGPAVKVALNSAIPALTPSYVGFVAGDTAATLTIAPNAAPVCTTTATNTSPLGVYPVTCSGAIDPNYTIGYVAGTVTIVQNLLTVTAPSPSMTYGSALPALTPTYSPALPAGATAATCSTTATPLSVPGSYPVTCTGAVAAGYTISYVAGTLTVNAATLTVSGNGTMVYGGALPPATITGFVNGQTVAVLTTQPTCTTTATSASPVGTYPRTCTGGAAPNYNLTYVAGTITVNPAALTITAGSPAMTYGGAVPAITPVYTGFVNGQTSAVVVPAPTCSTVANSSSPVGTYATTCGGAAAANYAIAYLPGTLTVNPATLTITASSATMFVGSAPPVITPSYAGFVNGQTAAIVVPAPACSTSATAASVAGTYPSTCSGAAAPNYTIVYAAGTVTVTNVKALTVTGPSPTIIYGSPIPALTPIYAPALPLGATGATCTTTATAASGTGTYPVSCSGVVAAGYTITYVTGTLTISPAPMTITAPSPIMTYGGVVPALTPTYSPALPAGPGVVAATCATTPTVTSTTAAGSYPVTCSGAVVPNYAITYVAGTLKVNPVPITITAPSPTMLFGTAVPALTPAYAPALPTGAGITGATCATTPVVTATSNVGTYPVACSGAVIPNYAITYVAGTLTITPAPLVVTATSGSMTYGGAVPAINALYSPALPAGATAATCSTTATSASIVGTYPTTCTGAIAVNYAVSYVGGTVIVNPAPLTITASSVTFPIGSPVPAITPIYNPTAAVLGANLTKAPLCSTTATSASPAGSYPSSCLGAGVSNYTITYVAGTVTVTPLAVTITAPSPTMTYGGPVPATLTPTYSPGIPASLTVPPTCSTTATAASPVGSYPVTCSGAVAAGYTITYVTGSLTVTAAPLTVTAGNATMTYGGAVPAITPVVTGLVNGQTAAVLTPAPVCSTTATAASNVGAYPSSCSGPPTAPNYIVSYAPGTVTVTAAPLTITASSAAMTYGGAAPAITAIVTGLVNGQTTAVLTPQPICSTTAASTSNVGAYPSTCSGVVTAPNYTFSYVAGTVTVNKAPASVTPAAASKVYGTTPDPALTGTLTGFLARDAVTATYSRTAGENVGTYTISATLSPAAALTNYTITYNTGAFTITPATLTITASSFAPDQANVPMPPVTPIYSGFVFTDTAAIVVTPPACSAPGANWDTGGGATWPSSCSGAVLSTNNYTIAYVPGQYILP